MKKQGSKKLGGKTPMKLKVDLVTVKPLDPADATAVVGGKSASCAECAPG